MMIAIKWRDSAMLAAIMRLYDAAFRSKPEQRAHPISQSLDTQAAIFVEAEGESAAKPIPPPEPTFRLFIMIGAMGASNPP
jgi:hypothetical protein